MACFNDFDLAVVKVEERIPARAYGCRIYISKTLKISTTPIVRGDVAGLVTARRRKTLHKLDAQQIHLPYLTRRHDATHKAARRNTAKEGWPD